MNFRAFSSILFGMALLGFSIGVVVGIYLQWRTGNRGWAYLAVPFMGLGSAFAAYGTLSSQSKKTAKSHTSENNNG